ncbi:MAG: hypothetical protein LUE31_12825, partial [Lachnospiraceae bacterium]|nr:hypothetical protein [Lachnospiraceae bacterium]
IYSGGNSKARNPHMQTMLRMIGFGDNAGSGFPKILNVWADNGWKRPELDEDTVMNQVTLTLLLSTGQSEERSDESENLSAEKSAESAEKSAESAESMNSELLNSLSARQREIFEFMEKGKPYSSQEIADVLGVKLPRTRQLLNELLSLGLIQATAATKNRRYIKI